MAVGGLILSVQKQVSEQTQQREADRKQRQAELDQRKDDLRRESEAREREREQREAATLQRLEARFSASLTELGDDKEAVQAGAAVSLLSFLRPEHETFHRQVRLIALANLKVKHQEPVRRLLMHVFEQAARLSPPEPLERDLSDANLIGAELAGLDLEGADLDRARLKDASLENVVLREATGRAVELTGARICGPQTNLHAIRLKELTAPGANFREANLTAAHLEEANLRGAKFQKTRLQAAHLEGADLRGAQFQQADLRDAYFVDRQEKETKLDDAALLSLLGALHREDAHFSQEHKRRLDQLAELRRARGQSAGT